MNINVSDTITVTDIPQYYEDSLIVTERVTTSLVLFINKSETITVTESIRKIKDNFTQPALPSYRGYGWLFNSIDLQIVTKSEGWNQDQTKRLNEYQELLNLEANYAALAVPYDNVTKYSNYVADARTKSLKLWHRSHWNGWEGDNGWDSVSGGVTSITRSGSVATVTTSGNHGLVSGQSVVIAGAIQTEYNGQFVVTVTGLTTFTYTVSGTPATPATGTITWQLQNYITRSGQTATLVTVKPHLLSEGHTIVITGANQSEYNGEFTVSKVIDSYSINFVVSGSPATIGTGFIRFRYSRYTYLEKTYQFIIDHPTFFASGDLFGLCVECNNADGSGNNWTFRDTNLSSGTFSYTKYNRFLKDQVAWANAAFEVAGISGIYTWAISMGLSNLNLNGQTLDGGDTGNGSGLGDSDIATYFAGFLTIDHYLSDSYRDTDNYGTKYASDLDKLHTAFPSAKIMIGEWGYHTTVAVGDTEQETVYADVITTGIQPKNYLVGVNFWVHMGSTTASIFNDSGGTIVPGGRPAAGEIEAAFTDDNNSFPLINKSDSINVTEAVSVSLALSSLVTPVLDDFNRANSTTTLGSNWGLMANYGGSLANQGIISNQAYNPTAQFANYSAMYWNPKKFGPDSEVYLTLATVPSPDSDSPGIYLRMNGMGLSANNSGYVFGLNTSANTVHISRIDNGVETQLGASVPHIFVNGEKILFRAIGNTLTAYYYSGGSWNLLLSRTDSTYTGSGYLAMYFPGNQVDGRYEDFGGGSIYNIEISESITLTEATTVTITALPVLTVNVSDGITVLDVIRNYQDTITVNENVSVALAHNINKSETVTITESISRTLSSPQLSTSDSITASEFISVVLHSLINIINNISVTENRSVSLAGSINTTDTITLNESVVLTISSAQINVSDTITVLDIIRNYQDTITVNESVSVALGHNIGKSESISVSESLLLSEPALIINVSESIKVYEGSLVSTIAQLTDTVNIAPIYGDAGGTTEQRRAQSFVAVTDRVSALSFKYFSFGTPTDSLVFEIWTDSGGIPGTLLQTANAVDLVTAVNFSIITTIFPTPVNLTPGTTYWIVARRTGTRDTVNAPTIYIAFNTNPYAGGSMLRYDSGSWVADYANSDWYFQLYHQTIFLESVNFLDVAKSENITVSESLSVLLLTLLIISDSVTVSELVSLLIGLALSVLDSITLSENTTLIVNININVNENITVSELVEFNPPASINTSESIVVGESINLGFETENSLINVSDSVEVVDIPQYYEDTIFIADPVNAALAFQISVSDSINVLEVPPSPLTFTILLVGLIDKTEAITVTESTIVTIIVLTHSISVSESITVTENLTIKPNTEIALSENITISETVLLVRDNILDIYVYDRVTPIEVTSWLQDENGFPVLDENGQVIADEDAQSLINLSIADNINKSETITVTESRSLFFTSLNVTVSDSIVVIENIQFSGIPNLNISESISLSEAYLVAFEGSGIPILEAISVAENVVVFIPLLFVNTTEDITVTEAITIIEPIGITVSDTVTVVENRLTVVSIQITKTDSVSVTENLNLSSITPGFNWLVAISDQVTINESVDLSAQAAVINKSIRVEIRSLAMRVEISKLDRFYRVAIRKL